MMILLLSLLLPIFSITSRSKSILRYQSDPEGDCGRLRIQSTANIIMPHKATTTTADNADRSSSHPFSSSNAVTAKDRELRVRLGSGGTHRLTTLQQGPPLNTINAPTRCSAGLILLLIRNRTSLVMASHKIPRKLTRRWTRLCVSCRRVLGMASFDWVLGR